MVFGEDVKLPGDLTPYNDWHLIDDIKKVAQANIDQPAAQSTTHGTKQTYMPPATTTATHVYTKVAKHKPLEAKYKGPYKILDRLGKSCLRLKVGEFANS